MKNLLYKEWKLCAHPTTYLFAIFGAMLLIPSYPYFVAFMYTCLGVFFLFLTGRENKDVFYSATLPVAKREIVRARALFVGIMETATVLLAVPFALLHYQICPGPNAVGLDINPAMFGLTLLMYGVFNLLYLPAFYRDGYSCGKALLLGGTFVGLFILFIEAGVHFLPFLMALDTCDPAGMKGQIPLAIVCAAAFLLLSALACRISEKRFEKVDL